MKWLLLYYPLLLLVFFLPHAGAQDLSSVRLKQKKADFMLKSFYVSEVTDSMSPPDVIGVMTNDNGKRPIAMQEHLAAAVKTYIDNNVPENKEAQPVTLNIKKLHFSVEKQGRLWVITGDMAVTFFAGGIKLVGYYNNGQEQTDTLTDAFIDEFIRRATGECLVKFDQWWSTHKNEYPVSQQVKVNVNIGKTSSVPECIVYNANRPLTVGDFNGHVEIDSNENAVTFSGFDFLEAVSVKEGQLVVNLTITPCFNKSKSWFKVGAGSKILLAHEQGHFDITAINACELVEQLRHTTFTKDNYKTLIDELGKEYEQKKNDEQNAYDSETNHSKIMDKQLEWQHKISEQMKGLECYQ